MMPPVRDFCREWGVTITYASCWDIGSSRGGLGRWRGCGLAAKDLKHHRSAGRALALDGLATILHGLFDGIGDLPLGFTLNAISFGHKKSAITERRMRPWSTQLAYRRGVSGAIRKPSE